MSNKEQLQAEAARALHLAQLAEREARYATGSQYFKEKQVAEAMWQRHHDLQRQADECTD